MDFIEECDLNYMAPSYEAYLAFAINDTNARQPYMTAGEKTYCARQLAAQWYNNAIRKQEAAREKREEMERVAEANAKLRAATAMIAAPTMKDATEQTAS
jgi:hypothetical protein